MSLHVWSLFGGIGLQPRATYGHSVDDAVVGSGCSGLAAIHQRILELVNIGPYTAPVGTRVLVIFYFVRRLGNGTCCSGK